MKSAGLMWAAAAAVAALGSWILFDAMPGLNWFLWVVMATSGLIWLAGSAGTATPVVWGLGGVAVALAGTALVAGSEVILVLACGGVILYLAMQMLLAGAGKWSALTPLVAVTAPPRAFFLAMRSTLYEAIDATNQVRSPKAGAGLRGLAITAPVLIVFALLLSMADPVFATWRITIENQIADWSFLGRIIFFFGLLGIVLGAYAYATRPATEKVAASGAAHSRWLGSTERLILFGSVAALFWLFIGLQLSYLFGNTPGVAGSGMTFSEYARRGFAELTVVVSACAVLIILAEWFGARDGREKEVRVVTFGVLIALFFMVASALYRVALYEQAYGFTEARLYGKTYMVAIAFGLGALCLEVGRVFDETRLFRRSLAIATVLFLGLAYWNHEAWIARRNIERFASAGQLDTRYLAGLSPAAIPAIADAMRTLPEPQLAELVTAVRASYERRAPDFDREWYEWNLATERARAPLAADFGVTY